MGAPNATSTAVLGAGSWGTALALLLSRNAHPTVLWAHRPEHAAAMAHERRNARFLPDAEFPPLLKVTANLGDAVGEAQNILLVVPSKAFREVLLAIAPLVRPDQRIVWGTKGLEHETCALLHTVVEDVFGAERAMAVVSGPSFAGEVAAGLPTAVTVASPDMACANEVAALLHSDYFRAYTSTDIVGVQLGGAAKNVLAIAAGISDGLGFGANARAALITRGLHELMRLGMALGGQAETFMGLAGLGDLVLTCTDNQSRNRRAGLALGGGATLAQALSDIGQVVEGVQAAQEVRALAKRLEVDMPIAEQVWRVLYDGLDPHRAVRTLLAREQKPENI
ncbi:MAG: hypothetical protein AMJ69_09620 [Gammaproteobacteria bacterium SG8_47]|nr:MAG: hypothetical protein AMJ69_09620 [Gammaproteobacteria bacterium SG8_47]